MRTWQHAKESGLTQEDGKVLVGALTYKDRTVGQVLHIFTTYLYYIHNIFTTYMTVLVGALTYKDRTVGQVCGSAI